MPGQTESGVLMCERVGEDGRCFDHFCSTGHVLKNLCFCLEQNTPCHMGVGGVGKRKRDMKRVLFTVKGK